MKKLFRIFAVVMTLSLLVGLFVAAIPVSGATTYGPGANKFGEIKLPVLYPGSDVGTVDIAPDGTIFAAFYIDTDVPADGAPDDWGVLKSTDGGYTWTATKYVPQGDHISAIEVSANYASDGAFFVATATTAGIFKVDSTLMLPILPAQDSEADAAGTIFDLESWFDGTHIWLLAGTDVDALIIEIAQPATNWLDLELAGDPSDDQAAYRVAFASDFATSNRFWALTNTDINTVEAGDYVLTSTIIPGQWGTTIMPWVSNVNPDHPFAVDFEEAPGYTNAAPMFYVALSGNGDENVYLVQANATAASGMALYTAGDMDFGSVEVAGTSIIVGEVGTGCVYISHNAGDTWVEATRGPGAHTTDNVRVEMWGDYDPDTGIVLGFASGGASGVFRSEDGGDTFNGIAMLNGAIDNIRDLGFSPITASQPMLMITEDETTFGHDVYSIWRTADATSSSPVWERICFSSDSFNLINYTLDGAAIILQDGDTLYKSTDNGQTFLTWRTLPGGMGHVEDWIAPNGTTIYIAASGGFYGTSSFGPAIFNALGDLESIAMFEDTIMCGDDDGNVFISLDKGNTWSAAQELVDDTVDVLVAFGPTGTPYFATSDSTVGTFAISSTGTVVKTPSTSVKDVKDSANGTATEESFTGIWVSPDDTLYALGGQAMVTAPSSTFYAWGMVELDFDLGMMGSSTYADASSSVGGDVLTSGAIDVQGVTGGGTASLTMDDFSLVTLTGTFQDGEDLLIAAPFVTAVNGNIAVGPLPVMGDSSGATGIVDAVWVDVTVTGTAWVEDEILAITAVTDTPQFDDDEDMIRVAVMGEAVTVVETGFADGDMPLVYSSNLVVDDTFPTDISGWIGLQNPVIGKGTISGAWDANFGLENDDLGLLVEEIDDNDIQLVEDVATVTTQVAEVNLWRLLIGESKNLWETEAIDDAYGLWGTTGSNILWTIVDGSSGDEIWALEDLLSGPVSLLSPADGSTVVSATKALLEWDAYDGATKYEGMYLDMDTVGATPVMFTTTKTSTNTGTFFEATGLIKNHDYCWKVRALVDSPFQSRWSATWGFFTHDALDTPENKVPLMGAQDYTLYPSFVWGAVSGADSYELEISANPDFSDAIVVATDLTQYTQTTALEADTNYYWRVRAISDVGGVSGWCVSNFHTAAAQAPPVVVDVPPVQNITLTVPQPETPGYIWAIIAVGAILTIAVIVLIVRTRRVV